jgi:hypothetical protein
MSFKNSLLVSARYEVVASTVAGTVTFTFKRRAPMGLLPMPVRMHVSAKPGPAAGRLTAKASPNNAAFTTGPVAPAAVAPQVISALIDVDGASGTDPTLGITTDDTTDIHDVVIEGPDGILLVGTWTAAS